MTSDRQLSLFQPALIRHRCRMCGHALDRTNTALVGSRCPRCIAGLFVADLGVHFRPTETVNPGSYL